jgi:hypothetical protein
MKTRLPLNARSEFAKLSPADERVGDDGPVTVVSGDACGVAGIDAGVVVSGGVSSPAGVFGSKNPSGFGRLATSSMCRAACPASRRPGFSPTRGSGGCWAAPLIVRRRTPSEPQSHLMTPDFISETP